MTIVRADGSRLASNIIIADTAPGFVTGHSCRGPAIGSATQVFKDGRSATTPLSSCKGTHCTTIPVHVSPDATTRVQISSTGFRNAGRDDKIQVTIGGVPVRVVSFQPGADPGEDHLIIEIP